MAVTVKTEGRIDGNTVKHFEEQMTEAVSGDDKELFVDMVDTTYICSSALRVFLKFHKDLKKVGGSLVIRNVKPQITEIFEVTGFSGVLTFED